MANSDQIANSICESYAKAINGGNASAYSNLFTPDVEWMAPGAPIRSGRQEIVDALEGAFGVNKLEIEMTPSEAIQVSPDYIYAISHVNGMLTAKADGTKSPFKFTVVQLIQRQESGEWLVRRQIWNNKPVS